MQRTVPLPRNVNDENISASYVDGVLHVNVPKVPGKAAEPDTKLIEVK